MAHPTTRRPQPLPIRLTHWLNVPVLTVMAMSGLQIFLAYPYFGPRGATYDWLPFQHFVAPDWMRAGQWLAGARHLHFALAWLLVGNALIWLGYLAATGEFRRRLFWPPRDLRGALHQVMFYLRLRKDPPPLDLYNGLQRAAYTSAIALGVLVVLSGLVIWKPVQLHHLAWCMGGYDGARVVHFFGMLAIAGFVVTHVIMVALHPKSFVEMVTGGHAPTAVVVSAEPAETTAAPETVEPPADTTAPTETAAAPATVEPPADTTAPPETAAPPADTAAAPADTTMPAPAEEPHDA